MTGDRDPAESADSTPEPAAVETTAATPTSAPAEKTSTAPPQLEESYYRGWIPALVVVVIAVVVVSFQNSLKDDDTNILEEEEEDLKIAIPRLIWSWFLGPLLNLARQIVGVSIGVALGLGLAAHVYDQLTEWNEKQQLEQQQAQARTTTQMALRTSGTTPRSTSHSTPALQDEQTYASLMQSAGYLRDSALSPANRLLRGQVVTPNKDDWWHACNTNFHCLPYTPMATTTTQGPQHAWNTLTEYFPTLPEPVRHQLAQFIELVLRDFVACWYKSVDEGCRYQDAAEAQAAAEAVVTQTKEDAATTTNKEASSQQAQQQQRIMLYSLAYHRTSPFLNSLYDSMAMLFGNLATRVEHVNLLQVTLLQWTRILAHTFKVYRTLRKSVQHKERQQQLASSASVHSRINNNPETATASTTTTTTTTAVSEIAMTKEFLFCNKLHKAVTFGLDVPSLLFADASGKECGVPGSTSSAHDDDYVLEQRLFGTDLLTQCELDYNRVVAHRMIRALTPRQDFGSPIVSTLLTEIMAGCVLTPLMGCFGPDYLNSWIVKGLATTTSTTTPGETQDVETDAQDETNASPIDGTIAEGDSRGGVESEDPTTSRTIDQLLGSIKDDEDDDKDEPAAESLSVSQNQETTSLEVVSTTVQDDGDESRRNGSNNNDGQQPLSDFSDGLASLVSTEGQPHSEANSTTVEDSIISLLALALIDVQKYIDFEDVRIAKENNQEITVDWDDLGCRSAVVRLVLVIELALTHGRCSYKLRPVENQSGSADDEDDLAVVEEESGELEEEEIDLDDSDRPVEVTLPEYESTTLSQILMEMTSDIEAFEERVATENTLAAEKNANKYDGMLVEEYKPTSSEQSTLRTLIAAWLHTGHIFRAITVLVQAHATVLAPYYHQNSFLRSRTGARGFVRQLKALEDVDIMVDTMTVLQVPRLDETDDAGLQDLVRRSALPSPRQQLSGSPDEAEMKRSFTASQRLASSRTTPRYLHFHRNESFAASLRSERDRRVLSWRSSGIDTGEDGFVPVCRSKGATQEAIALHRELHHIARLFYTGTNLIAIRDAAKRKNSKESGEGGSASETASVASEDVHLSLLTVETACPRRRIEVPDDDSSFLLRAQPRALNAVGVHRDQRNHDQSFKCFAATYYEPTFSSASGYARGRYVRRCLVRYYPIDRTASVALQTDSSKLDQRKNTVPDMITLDQSSRPAPVLSSDFLRERHLCKRWIPQGTARSQSILASSVLEPTDFTSIPRPGKAIDYVYKLSFFENPMIDLAGKHFVVHDSSSLGVHRTDASSMELSDASLSIALLTLGATMGDPDSASSRQAVQMGKDGYPVVWMKFSRKQDDAHIEVKPYRTSFVRAALLVTAARQEAQLQCLLMCVRAGSAKKATKALTDAQLKPTLRLIEHAGSRSREKRSLLLRDLKLGVNHIDREQLRRNGLLCPRYPTELVELTASVEDAVQTSDGGGDFFGASGTTYKIRCVAKVRLVVRDEELNGDIGYRKEDGSIGRFFLEEWVVYRSFKEFQALHKQLKSQVSANMSSGTAGSRLVGAATAAFTATASQSNASTRESLVPSLSQASKAGALGVTKKSIVRRKEILDGYMQYMLSPGNLIRNCPELLLFLGAFYPLSPRVRVGETIPGGDDPLGRTEMSRSVIQVPADYEHTQIEAVGSSRAGTSPPAQSTSAASEIDQDEDAFEDEEEKDARKSLKNIAMIPSIRAKIEKVPLSQVRNRVFELLRYQFGFENASFIRNRMLAALKTASFAVTSPSEFKKTLYKLHTNHLSGPAVAELIKMGSDLLWPSGVFFESAPPYTQEELEAQSSGAKKALHDSFPEQVRTILGQELTKDGLDMFHEMLQNRMVVKSMAYMMFDLLWLEVFPEIGDVLECGSALDIGQ